MLGKGQQGSTYRVTNKDTGAEAACKVISRWKPVIKGEVDIVRREISFLHLLGGHPNVVGLIDAYEDSKHVYIVKEYCKGGELFDRVIERKHYSEKDAAELFRAIVRTLKHCHDLGVTHRDLKLSNVLVTSKGRAKLVDFGLAAVRIDKDADVADCPNARAIDYAALERATGTRKDDIRTDLYFAGCIL